MESSRRNSEIIRQRVLRHNRLMKLIKGYTRTEQQIRKLQRIKVNTMMEINLRYLRSQPNRYYKFPQKTEESQQDEAQQQVSRKQNMFYDLRSQNQLMKVKSISRKVISLDSTRKIKSLDIQRNQWQRERLLRLNAKSKQNLSLKKLRKNSLSDRIKRDQSRFKLPEIRLDREKLKTEAKNTENEEMQSVIGKKLATESSEKAMKLKGVQKYLKKVEEKQKQNLERQRNSKPRKLFCPETLS